MLTHLSPAPLRPARVAIIGAGGFVGGAVARRLQRDGITVAAIGRAEVDLLAPGAERKLAALLAAGDVVVAASAIAPCKNADMLVDNVVLARAITRAVATVEVAHVVNIGSDAIYADSAEPLTESSVAAPESLHGVMHLARELMLRSEVKAPLATIRPTLIFGPGDPHDGYGPNKFRRQAARGEGIVLFGEGEERRDHIFIDDVAELVVQAIYHRSSGALNAATGEVRSFRQVAEAVVALAPKPVGIAGSPRRGPMPHNGLRPFDVAAVRQAFPAFNFTPFETALRLSQSDA
jgi:nucleoside-diphosphate-sugar epimerase